MRKTYQNVISELRKLFSLDSPIILSFRSKIIILALLVFLFFNVVIMVSIREKFTCENCFRKKHGKGYRIEAFGAEPTVCFDCMIEIKAFQVTYKIKHLLSDYE